MAHVPVKLSLGKGIREVVFVRTGGLAIWRQLGTWHDASTRLLCMPSHQFELLFVIPRGQVLGEERPLYGCVISRPAAVEFEFSSDVRYGVDVVGMDVARAIFKRFEFSTHFKAGRRGKRRTATR